MQKDLDEDGLPTRKGVYLLEEPSPSGIPTQSEVDVYEHPKEGLCCFDEDLKWDGGGLGDHVPVGLVEGRFLKRLRDLS